MNVPQSVARGMLRSGSMTLSDGTVAHSSPSNAHNVNVADAVIAEIVNGCGSNLMTLVSCAANSQKASAMIPSSGSSFNTVVTICTTPMCLTPRQLRNVRSQISTTEATA